MEASHCGCSAFAILCIRLAWRGVALRRVQSYRYSAMDHIGVRSEFPSAFCYWLFDYISCVVSGVLNKRKIPIERLRNFS